MHDLIAPEQLTRLFADPAFRWLIAHFEAQQNRTSGALEGCSCEKEMFKMQGNLQVFRKITDPNLMQRMMEELTKQWKTKQQ